MYFSGKHNACKYIKINNKKIENLFCNLLYDKNS
jgi:hypothetical protein